MISYVSLNDDFIKGIKKWFKKNNIDPKKHVAEVFAGTGALGKKLGLVQLNITDAKVWETDELLAESLDEQWKKTAASVHKADAVKSIQNFKDNEDDIKVLIMGAPTNENDSAFKTIIALKEEFPNAKILFIGPDKFVEGDGQVATEEFYIHATIDSTDDFFVQNVRQKYDMSVDYLYNTYNIESLPSLRDFITCGNTKCLCNQTNPVLVEEEENEEFENNNVIIDENGNVHLVDEDDDDDLY